MNLREQTFSNLVDALPDHFDFYHLGNVEMTPVSETATTEFPDLHKFMDDQNVLAFVLQGDLRAILVVTFEKGLDVSTYTELGNILASQLATRLSEQAGIEVMISPPLPVTDSHMEMLPRLSTLLAQRTYRHSDRGKVVTLKTLLLASASGSTTNAYEGFGHA